MGLDFLPFVGSGKSAWQLYTGTDAVTGEDSSRWANGIGLAAGVLPFGKAGLRLLEEGATIDTAAVRFTQDSVKGSFKNGTNINDAAAALRAGGADAASKYPPIRLVDHGGQLFTLDNRRLLVFSMAGQQVPFRMATQSEIAREWVSKFTTTELQEFGRLVGVRP
jgi:hypothetical protein